MIDGGSRELQIASSAIALALGLGVLACNSDTPTSPKMTSINNLLGSIGGLATPASTPYLPGGFGFSLGAVPIFRSA